MMFVSKTRISLATMAYHKRIHALCSAFILTYIMANHTHYSSTLARDIQCFSRSSITHWIPHEEEYATLTNVTTCERACVPQCLCKLTNNSFINYCRGGEAEVTTATYPSSSVSTLFLANYSLDILSPFAFIELADRLNDLYLNNNSIQEIHRDVFDGLENLVSLHLYNNELKEIPPGTFGGLVSLQTLDLVSNVITDLHQGAFTGLDQLRVLDLGSNRLTTLQPGVFTGLKQLENLNVELNNLTSIESNVFDGLGLLEKLSLDENNLTRLFAGVFDGLVKVEELDLDYNKLQVVPLTVFRGLTEIIELDLDFNMIQELQTGVFEGLVNVEELELDHNVLTAIPPSLFQDLINVKRLSISHNMVLELHPSTFNRLNNLIELHLSYNNLSELHASIFQNVSDLVILFLDHNNFVNLNTNLFANFKHLEALSIATNQITTLQRGVFQDMHALRFLNLSRNMLQGFSSETFENSVMMTTLDLTHNPLLWVNQKVFDPLTTLTTIYVDDFATCCFIQFAKCSFESPPSPFISCKRLLPYFILRVVIWVIGIATVFGNIFVLFSRSKDRRRGTVQYLLTKNLSMSDLLMGIYMMILLSVDMYYKDFFPSHSEPWRHSILCRVAGALSLLSSEASVFFITLISIDRYMGVTFPFAVIRLRKTSAKIVVALLWFIALLLCIASVLIPIVNSALYDVSEICVGLPISRRNSYILETKSFNLNTSSFEVGLDIGTAVEAKFTDSKSSMYFSIAIFTVLNLCCFLVVAFCYLSIFIIAKQTSRQAGRSTTVNDELKMAFKMAGIVFSDFCCWMVVVVLSILVQSGAVTIQPVAYSWIATFVLPINACINPFLYTLASMILDRFQRKHKSNNSETILNLKNKNRTRVAIK